MTDSPLMNNRKPTILVVDDELSIRESFSLILEERYKVLVAASGEACLKKLVDEAVDIVYLDIRMPGMDGIETLNRAKKIDPDATVIMVTAVNDVQKAGEAIKLGAEDYVVKPFDVEKILAMTAKVVQKKILSTESREAQGAVSQKGLQLIGGSRHMEEIRRLISRLSGSNENVVISGERGSEFELVARLIHFGGRRGIGPFIAINAAGGSARALRARLFGSGRGDFAETLEKEKGSLERAAGGTLFIENLDDMPKKLQGALAEAMGQKKIRREGSDAEIPVSARLICSVSGSAKSLEKGLYEAACRVLIEIPPLRSRSSDIPELVEHFIEKYKFTYDNSIESFTKESMDVLMGYPFPGNVDELDGIVEEMVLTSKSGEITLERLPLNVLANSRALMGDQGAGKTSFDSSYDRLEAKYIGLALDSAGGNVAAAAESLGIRERALSAKIERHKIKV